MTEPYIVVSDESGMDGSNRYQSIAFVSGPCSRIVEFNKYCREVLTKHCATELKWSEIATGEKNRASIEIIERFFISHDLRVLVLCWDTQDTRHSVKGRDDEENFHRMLYHGLRTNADWHGRKEWYWFPDERTSLDHATVQAFLNATAENKRAAKYPKLIEYHRDNLLFRTVKRKCSKEVPIIGVADLFAGVVRDSVEHGASMLKAHAALRERDTPSIFGDEYKIDLGKRREKARAEFGALIYRLGAQGKHGISLRTHCKLTTHGKQGRFFFWHYEPQGEYDKAPIRSK
jgi:hypothetical protein